MSGTPKYFTIKADGTGRSNFGHHEHNGGTSIQFSFYDVVGRSKYLGANNAWDRFNIVVNEFNKDGMYRETQSYNGIDCHYRQFFVASPESGLPPLAYNEAFLGITAQPDGLHISPNLPTSLTHAGIKRVYHWNHVYTIEARKDISQPSISGVGTNRTIRIPHGKSIVVANGRIISGAPTPTSRPTSTPRPQKKPSYTGQVVSALRGQFGGHSVENK